MRWFYRFAYGRLLIWAVKEWRQKMAEEKCKHPKEKRIKAGPRTLCAECGHEFGSTLLLTPEEIADLKAALGIEDKEPATPPPAKTLHDKMFGERKKEEKK